DPLAVSPTAQDDAQFPSVGLTGGRIGSAFVTGPVSHQQIGLFFRRVPFPGITLKHPALERAFWPLQLPRNAHIPSAAPIALLGRDLRHHLLQFTALALPTFQAQKLPQRDPSRLAVGALEPTPVKVDRPQAGAQLPLQTVLHLVARMFAFTF